MARIISVHSYRGGTGKSNTSANLAALLAVRGQRVGIVDTDIMSPGIHVLFGMSQDPAGPVLNDYLWGKCEIKDAAYDVTNTIAENLPGRVFLVPASVQANNIARILREGYDVGLLNDGFDALIRDLNLDTLIIDTHPGLNEETLLSIAISDVLLIVLRPDLQDYQGTGVTVQVARKLSVPLLLLVVNKCPPSLDVEAVRKSVQETYNSEVAAVFPHSDEIMTLASGGVFTVKFPDLPVSATFNLLVDRILQ
jgi:MinD-like ATPase involved in chromosome partitioning or flagellar assembly